ncbi:hypothetical protein EDEG_01011 [Edhazardia aedis USNM 41457]|uniref:Uncharacterized protein n=1 Tax=Edhazardia aedis (strain USNM 41457) TaxID=1003232 RepID=J9DBC0_EDHAE|nr:hypothetical protein EDEG_01011 [Edhazardia aedis USNM 41457]|eukprot:EJW04789.1 hypothetical protein EDEG_01011 [Edhazardia aedis USNM 41457]
MPADHTFVLLPIPGLLFSAAVHLSVWVHSQSLNRLAGSKFGKESVILETLNLELEGTIILCESSSSISFNVFTTVNKQYLTKEGKSCEEIEHNFISIKEVLIADRS